MVPYAMDGGWNTDKIANIFGRILSVKGAVDIQRLRPQMEITSFVAQCAAARKHEKALLSDNVNFDATPYDMILIGSPVWAFAPAPAVNMFLDKISGLNGKRVVVLLTSGSGLGVKACFNNIRKILEAKGAGRIDEINIPDRNSKDEGFVASSLQKIL
jgi:flavodoxin